MGEKVVFTEACREEMIVPILSTGQESTVANWIALSNVVFGHDSKNCTRRQRNKDGQS